MPAQARDEGGPPSRSPLFADDLGRRVLATVLDLVGQDRYEDATVEDIAADVGVRPSELYARWASKPELVATAIHARLAEIRVPEGGDLREDLVGFASAWIGACGGDLLPLHRGVVTRIHRSPDMVMAYRIVSRYVAGAVGSIVGRAVERGQLPADAPADLAEEMLRARWWYCLVMATPMRESDAAETVDGALLPILRHRRHHRHAVHGR